MMLELQSVTRLKFSSYLKFFFSLVKMFLIGIGIVRL